MSQKAREGLQQAMKYWLEARVVAATRHPKWSIRLLAVETLARFSGHDSFKALMRALVKEQDFRVYQAAEKSLKDRFEGFSIDWLEGILKIDQQRVNPRFHQLVREHLCERAITNQAAVIIRRATMIVPIPSNGKARATQPSLAHTR